MTSYSLSLERPTLLVLVALCALIGAATAIAPLAGAIVPMTVVAFLLLSRMDRPVLFLFIAFLILQDPCLFFVGGDASPAGFVIKRLDEAFLYSIAFWVLISSRLARQALSVPRLGFLVAGCFGGMIASTLIVGVRWIPVLTDLTLFSKPFLLFAIGTSIRADASDVRKDLRIAVPCMMFVVAFAAVFLVAPSWQEAYLGALRTPDERIGMLSAQGFFDGPGPYSWFCAATFAVTYAAYLAFGRTVYLASAITAAMFAILSWRRKSIGGIVIMVIVAAAIQLGRDPATRRRGLLVLAIAALVALTILAPVITALWQYTLHEYSGDPGSLARVALHYTSLAIARDYFPFGTGLASFGSYASAVYYSDVYTSYGLSTVWGLTPSYSAYITDTFWPMVLGQGGVISFVPYVLIFVLLVRTFWSAARLPNTSKEDRFIALCALFLVLGSLLESTSSHIYDTSMQSALVMIPAGAAWSRFTVVVKHSIPAL